MRLMITDLHTSTTNLPKNMAGFAAPRLVTLMQVKGHVIMQRRSTEHPGPMLGRLCPTGDHQHEGAAPSSGESISDPPGAETQVDFALLRE